MSTNLSTWFSEPEAAAAIGVSVRTLQRYVEQGKIETRPRPREGRKPETVCNPRDVERLLPAAHVMPAEPEASTLHGTLQRSNGKAANPEAFFAFLASITTAIASRPNDAMMQPPRLWLSIEEAAAYSGLTENYIRCRVRENLIEAVRGGPRGELRIHRESLARFRG